MKQFVGKIGTIVNVELDGRTKMYRVKLDKPVEIPGVGLVEDDLWAGQYLKTISARLRDPDVDPLARCESCGNLYRDSYTLMNHHCRGE